ncbi:MAG: ABC transporter permease [Verrucomicrobiae bacterium]|nr:ABC transporter permease [Verrucomicrobiae bacterium]
MLNYLLRRILYLFPIVFGVMLITFSLFYVVQSPRAMALQILGPKAPKEAVANWLHNRGYDKPLFFNTAPGKPPLDSQFFHYIKSLAIFDFGVSDATGEPLTEVFKRGAIPSLLITLPSMLLGLFLSVSFSLFLVLVRKSLIDLTGVFICVVLMSFPIMDYVILGQWLIAIKTSYLPAFGFNLEGITTAKYLALPVCIAAVAGLGAETRLYRSIFLEEINQDYVRTAKAKGASPNRILFSHVFKNGLISLITLVVASLPFLIMGSLVLESFFGIPGLGNLTITAIRTSDFAVVRAVVYLGSLLYILGLLLTDICYAAVDPRIRFQ